nr:FAD:protein FMN transferase [Rhodoferax sp.]
MSVCEGANATVHVVQRARPMLGTLVALQVRLVQAAVPGGQQLEHIHGVMEMAFRRILNIEHAMSAHSPNSDLARLARAIPGDALTLSHHTVAVLRLAKYWYRVSLGAFDPAVAGDELAARGARPAFRGLAFARKATLRDVCVVGDDTVRLQCPIRLDFGGIAKGYAVDQALSILSSGGLANVLVNAGGDLRACGDWGWPVRVRSPGTPTHSGSLKGLQSVRNAALATSSGANTNVEFVRTARTRFSQHWNSCTVRAPDCVTADALTKWGLQSDPKSPRLERTLRTHRATMWRA